MSLFKSIRNYLLNLAESNNPKLAFVLAAKSELITQIENIFAHSVMASPTGLLGFDEPSQRLDSYFRPTFKPVKRERTVEINSQIQYERIGESERKSFENKLIRAYQESGLGMREFLSQNKVKFRKDGITYNFGAPFLKNWITKKEREATRDLQEYIVYSYSEKKDKELFEGNYKHKEQRIEQMVKDEISTTLFGRHRKASEDFVRYSLRDYK